MENFVELTGEEVFKLRLIDHAGPRISEKNEEYSYRRFAYKNRVFQVEEAVAQDLINGRVRSIELEATNFQRPILDADGIPTEEYETVQAWSYAGHVTWDQYINLTRSETEIQKIKMSVDPSFISFLESLKVKEKEGVEA